MNRAGRSILARCRQLLLAGLLAAGLQPALAADAPLSPDDLKLINRLTWGVNASEIARFRKLGRQGWIDYQLSPSAPISLPPEIESRLAGMAIV